MNKKDLKERDVAEFLLMNPNFFKSNPDVLNALEITHNSEGTVSLVQKQVENLRNDYNSTLENLAQFLENAKENERIFSLTKKITLALLEQENITDLIGELEKRFINDFGASVCKVLFFGGEINKLPKGRVVGKDLAIKSLGELIKPNQIYSGPIDVDSKAKKFLFGNKESIKECVLVSLKTKSVTAILMLGSEANEKYSAEKDSLFLEFISDVASSLIDRHNN
tara:strand:- start:273 stop:944 length:672 start_codon:yes stop_codon:yes gene_type:complete